MFDVLQGINSVLLCVVVVLSLALFPLYAKAYRERSPKRGLLPLHVCLVSSSHVGLAVAFILPSGIPSQIVGFLALLAGVAALVVIYQGTYTRMF